MEYAISDAYAAGAGDAAGSGGCMSVTSTSGYIGSLGRGSIVWSVVCVGSKSAAAVAVLKQIERTAGGR